VGPNQTATVGPSQVAKSNVELIDTKDGSLLWGQHYGSNSSEIQQIQNAVSAAIAAKLHGRRAVEAKQTATRHYTANPEAYEFYLKGNYYAAKFTKDDMKKAVEQFQRAVEVDSTYAPAYAELGYAYVMLSQPLGGLMPKDGEPKAKAAALKALEIDDGLARAHAVLGLVETIYDWNWIAAEKDFKLAVDKNPNEAIAHWGYAISPVSFAATRRGNHRSQTCGRGGSPRLDRAYCTCRTVRDGSSVRECNQRM